MNVFFLQMNCINNLCTTDLELLQVMYVCLTFTVDCRQSAVCCKLLSSVLLFQTFFSWPFLLHVPGNVLFFAIHNVNITK